MSYIKRTWVKGEAITAAKLNNLEEGVTEAKKEASQSGTAATNAQEAANKASSAADSATKAAQDIQNALSAHNTSNEAHEDLRKSVADMEQRITPIEKGGTGNATGEAPSASKLATPRTIQVNLSAADAASFDGSANIAPGVKGVLPAKYGGTGNQTGEAPSASKLATPRTIQVNLSDADAASFDGSANIAPGVKGMLPVKYGGHGATDAAGARKNLDVPSNAEMSRRNRVEDLVTNGDFYNPINQYGNTSVTVTGGFILDRWSVENANNDAGGSVSWATGGVTLTPTAENYISIVQKMAERYADLDWNWRTLAIQVNGVWETVQMQHGHETAGVTFPCGLVAYSSSTLLIIQNPAGNAAVTIQRVAYYNGRFTADTLPAYVYKGYAAELAECQRYYRKVINAQGYVSTVTGYFFLPYTMRKTPTVKINSVGTVRTQGQSFTPNGNYGVEMYADSIRISLSGTYTSEANHAAVLFGADIELSAE